VREGATIGAGCVVGNDLTIGRFAMIGMGSVVTKSVPDFHLALGHPAASVGCVCRCGQLLTRFQHDDDPTQTQHVECRACDRIYEIRDRVVTEKGSD
jgi:serine acetyltransferase